ncbi:MAG: sulfatase-like hydrolase/transferase [Pirellulaceae bacterium]
MVKITNIVLLLVLCWPFSNLVGQQPDSELQRPNIVLIMADDFGYECVGANGGTSWSTPHLDELARTGMRFEHCYSQPLCTPSRVQLMTGIYNVRNYTNFGVLPQSETTFANLLQDAGYATCVVGKWQLKGDPLQFGFDEYCLWQMNRVPERYPNPGLEINGERVDFTDGEYGPDVVSDYACDFIQRQADAEKPFLVYYPMILTHCPFCPTPDTNDWNPASAGSETYKGDPKYFGDMVAYMDKIAGKLASQLDASSVRENTLFMFTGDNGTDKPVVSMMGDVEVAGGKRQMTDAGTHVPLIANWPGTVASGATNSDLIDFSDFLPTVCAAASVDIPDSLSSDGVSFLPQLQGEPGTTRKWIFCWFARNGGAEGKQWTRNQRYKLYADGRFLDVAADPLEVTPLNREALTAGQRNVRELLQTALDQFVDARPEHVAAQGNK